MPSDWSLGLDTSAYTTSVAAVAADGRLVRQERQLLPVPMGSRGLRPSEALFYHVKNLPAMLERVMDGLDRHRLVVVGASQTPRPTPDSYLPPFLAGMLAAQAVALGRGVPLIHCTHQEGHIRAGLWSAAWDPADPFLALHISGGTTELLRVDRRTVPWSIDLVGGSDDLYAGQFVDRVGVALGLAFPAGPELDRLAESAAAPLALPWSRPRSRDGRWWTSFSGPESAARRALREGAEPTALAKGVMESISRSLSALVEAAAPPGHLLVVGGVAANTHLRRVMTARLQKNGWQIGFAAPEWSRDNAVGIALIAQERFLADEEDEKNEHDS
ncbi:peptidase M22 [Sulfobacillus sp. DSM 109850]|uniref:N(6)-L-threonylcarbamoyladenine synthase n=1 Tax=Sulfobacillus harzensis TaxID=2729629 RepID=A0A7Y0Q1S5_9FIRM|nr:peptidase M22 [Sulfobacillus harzensis]